MSQNERNRLANYTLVRLIRFGSSHQVWEARRDDNDVHYALKLLRPELRSNPEYFAYLKNDFESANSLKHKNIISMIEHHWEGMAPFFSMELFREINLKQVLRNGDNAITWNLRNIIEQSCEALAYMHSKRIVHCNIKPENFLVSSEFDIKLIDFSISRKIKTVFGRLFGERNKVEGTRWYMSPEQIRGQHLDARSDIYSMGCMLFELCTGEVPYQGNTPNQVLSQHLSATPPTASDRNNEVSPQMDSLINRMLAKNVNDRPRSIQEVLEEFRGIEAFH